MASGLPAHDHNPWCVECVAKGKREALAKDAAPLLADMLSDLWIECGGDTKYGTSFWEPFARLAVRRGAAFTGTPATKEDNHG